MIRVNVNLFPAGGYFFKEQDGSIHRAGNWKSVIQKVRVYRSRKGLTSGNVEEEVMVQACSRSPQLCYEDARREVVRAPTPLKARILMWLNGFLKSRAGGTPINYVSATEATQRAAICAVCPKNVPTGESGCAPCKQALVTFRKELIGLGRARDGRLGGCAVLGIDLVCAVHFDEIRIDNPHLPPPCWRKRGL